MRSRCESPPEPDTVDDLPVLPGTAADYAALQQFHYRRGRPGVISDVLRITHAAPTVVGRFLHRRVESQTVGVLVRSLPALACRLRDIATGNRYGNLNARNAAIVLNREVRCISRVIVDPRFRGMGLAVRIVRHALKHPPAGMIYTEALAAMGRVSPFFDRAGMARFDQPLRARAEHARLLDALNTIGMSPTMLTSHRAVEVYLSNADAPTRAFLDRELRRWHCVAHRTPKDRLKAMTFEELRCAARDELLSRPVYYLFHHLHAVNRMDVQEGI